MSSNHVGIDALHMVLVLVADEQEVEALLAAFARQLRLESVERGLERGRRCPSFRNR